MEVLSIWWNLSKSGDLVKMNRRQQVKRRVGKYEVGRTIGEGTFAKVKFARNSETGEPVALKILDKEKVLKHKMSEQVSLFSRLSVSFDLIRKLIFTYYLILVTDQKRDSYYEVD